MPVPSTVKPSKTLNLVKFTEKHSQVLKSTCNKKSWFDGQNEENKTIEYLKKNIHWKLKFHRLKTTYGEVDIVFFDEKNNLLKVFEVKKWNGKTPPEQRITQRQIQRLKTICFYLSDKYKKAITLDLALVYGENILLIPLDHF